MLKKVLWWIVISQLLILLFSFIFYKGINLLSYTNVSFIVGTFFILYSLAGYVLKGRFFDIVFYSFQHFFSRMQDKDRRPLSELVPQNYLIPFIVGVITIAVMLCTLLWYNLSI
ncbi:hypothetical protein BN988_03062 [Oceanobacillus picturae]|uniref:DUF3899 domain-containing protein n=1 Tax=Oceanobacillus picturae TaxID=171693 RepID=W9ANM4_9BACI|nr:DUF3899 domain-containing protein [Oceanobacillus picturae]RIU92772.1 DUF3899 domain-containing protein [Oceanobacillus picturae]CDO04502.1 hypothetical protein BN988_03062 [Oceanobacillus picturae]